MLFVGILTGLIGVLIDILVENLSEAKYSFIATSKINFYFCNNFILSLEIF